MNPDKLNETKKPVLIWLSTLCALLVVIVLVGGITRVTNSGLSMVNWKPITGIIPPLSEQSWQEEFEQYKKYPEYKTSPHMSLAEFKRIFFWEYIHRVIGRVIGLVFLIPFLFFLSRRYFEPRFTRKLLLGLCLGASQGVLGWYMVKSGLVNIPHVSHYRLAAHLILAFIIFGYLLWLVLDIVEIDRLPNSRTKHSLFNPLLAITVLILLQIAYGAFVAGRHAGLGYNTFPSMNGEWIPAEILGLSPLWLNFLENNTTLQFIHRFLAIALSVIISVIWIFRKKLNLAPTQLYRLNLLAVVILIQTSLGVATLLYVVPNTLAILHQFGALALFGATILLLHSLRSKDT